MKIKGILTFMVLIAFAGSTFPQHNFEFKYLNSNHGLSNEEVRDIFQDSQGYMWFLTSEGLNRFDGYEIEVYRKGDHPYNFPTSAFECICEDGNNRLWLGTYEKGAYILDKNQNKVLSFAEFANDPTFEGQCIRSMLADSQGNVWVGTENGLYRYSIKENKLTFINLLGTPTGERPWLIIEDLMEDADGNIWIATWSEGLFIYSQQKKSFRQYLHFDAIKGNGHNNSIISLYQDIENNVWIGTWEDGLYKTELKDGEILTLATYLFNANNQLSIPGNIVYDICEDKNQKLWVGTPYGICLIGKHLSSSPEIIRITEKAGNVAGLSNNEVWKIGKDRAGLIWLGTLDGGVNYVDPDGRMFKHYTIPMVDDQIRSQVILALSEDASGNILAGVKGLGFGIYDIGQNKYTPFTQSKSYKNLPPEINSVKCFANINGEMWLGTRFHGVMINHPQQGTYSQLTDEGNTAFDINSICPAPDGKVWIGTETGLYVTEADADKRNYYLANPINELSGIRINHVLCSNNGWIWVATAENGIFSVMYKDNSYRLKHYSFNKQNSPSDLIYNLYEDSKGNLWAGSIGNGPLYLNQPKDVFEKVLFPSIPGSLSITGISEDLLGNLWLSSNNGIYRLSQKDGDGYPVNIYGNGDGLQGKAFKPNSICRLSSGQILFGGFNGFNAITPEDVKTNLFIPPTIINTIEASSKNKTRKIHPSVQEVELDYREKSLSIQFSGLSYLNPEQNTFAYKLEGMQDFWQYTNATERKVTYNKLPPGDYTFKVKSANNSGLWNERPAILAISVLPAPYYTWWALTLYALAFLLLVTAIFRYMLNKAQTIHKLEIEQVKHTRNEKLNQYKMRFFTNISHELLTPLSIMLCSVDLLKTKTRKGKDELSRLERNIQQLKQLLNQLLDFNKMESGSIDLKVGPGDLHKQLKEIVFDFYPLAERKQISLKIAAANSQRQAYFDSEKLSKMVSNLLSNALKYTQPQGEIKVNLSFREISRKLIATIKITDNGNGIPEDELPHIFELFYRAGGNNKEQGTGIGLAHTKNLVDLHKGEITVESKQGKGTSFTIELPVYRDAYDAKEITGEVLVKTILKTNVALEETTTPTVPNTTIMLVEDNLDLLAVMREYFQGSFKVMVAHNGEEAFKKVVKLKPELIISDVMMPGMDGFELCYKLKHNVETSQIPLILLTAKNTELDRAKGYESGADSYISKPVSLPLLLARVNSLLLKEELVGQTPGQVEVVYAPNRKLGDKEFLKKLEKVAQEEFHHPEFRTSEMHTYFGMSSSSFYRKVKQLTKTTHCGICETIQAKPGCPDPQKE